jgi:hypothetical protein
MAQERARYEAELSARDGVGSSSTLANFFLHTIPFVLDAKGCAAHNNSTTTCTARPLSW